MEEWSIVFFRGTTTITRRTGEQPSLHMTPKMAKWSWLTSPGTYCVTAKDHAVTRVLRKDKMNDNVKDRDGDGRVCSGCFPRGACQRRGTPVRPAPSVKGTRLWRSSEEGRGLGLSARPAWHGWQVWRHGHVGAGSGDRGGAINKPAADLPGCPNGDAESEAELAAVFAEADTARARLDETRRSAKLGDDVVELRQYVEGVANVASFPSS